MLFYCTQVNVKVNVFIIVCAFWGDIVFNSAFPPVFSGDINANIQNSLTHVMYEISLLGLQ